LRCKLPPQGLLISCENAGPAKPLGRRIIAGGAFAQRVQVRDAGADRDLTIALLMKMILMISLCSRDFTINKKILDQILLTDKWPISGAI
jgi:hypothetical protein